MTAVVWLGERAMCWDQQLLSRLLTGPSWYHLNLRPEAEHIRVTINGERQTGAVVIVPARFHQPDEITKLVASLEWVVLVLTSDEESLFDHTAVEHPNMRLWVMTPRPGQHEPGPRYLGEGCADPSPLDDHGPHMEPLDARAFDVQFAGQVTHERRVAMLQAVASVPLPPGPERIVARITPTAGFTQGKPRAEYLAELANARVVLAPSGPATPDSFRAYEALEAGAVPIADGRCPGYEAEGYWTLVYPEGVPFPVVLDWADELGKTVDYVLGDWRRISNRCQAWWIGRKRKLYADLVDDVRALGGHQPEPDEITALVPTSPTRGGPEAAWDLLRTTVESVRERLPDAEIIVMCDGVRSEQEDLRAEYEQMLGRLMYACQREWRGVMPLVFDHHAHQANMTREALNLVRTPTVLFIEHDMPLEGEIPFSGLIAMVRSGFANVVRLGQDREREQYAQLMLDPEPALWIDQTTRAPGVPYVRTIQWSQRPHVASTGFYRQMVGTYFGTQSRTMIEDVMHGVVQTAYHRHGQAGWEQFRLVLYAPGGNEARSRHLDGRGEHDPKYPMVYAYDGPTPEGAPAPSQRLVAEGGPSIPLDKLQAMWSESGDES